ELVRGRQLHVEDARLLGDERLELGGDVADLAGAALLDHEAHEVADELVRAAEHLVEHARLHVRLDLGVLEERRQLGDRPDRCDEVLDLLAHGLDAALLPGRLEERACVDAVRDGYERLASSCEKSISESASSISLCWSAPVSDFRVIFSAASRERAATSRRISPRACCVAWSIWRSVSASRR